MRWDLAFDDPALERSFRAEMIARNRRPAVWIAAACVALMVSQIPVDLAVGEVLPIVTRLGCLAIVIPTAIALAMLSVEQFDRHVAWLTALFPLAFAAYFGLTVPMKTETPIGSDMAGMVMLTLVTGVGLGTLSLLSTRRIAVLAAICVVVSSTAVGVVLYPDLGQVISYATIAIAAGVVGVFTAHAMQGSRRAAHAASARSEALLHNVLPAQIAERLKDRPGAIAERFDEATVLFADLVGFTTLAEQMSPEQLVAMLDEVFTEFDEIAERHGLEKIKTIGDAYMVVGGVPSRRADHVEAVAAMALEMRAAIERRPPLRVRIGVHTGPVVAGVIGKKKFIYDLWGDTVNTASRMESHGVEGGIQVTTEVRDRLSPRFRIEPRGPVAIKGKGTFDVYLLTGCDTRDTSIPA